MGLSTSNSNNNPQGHEELAERAVSRMDKHGKKQGVKKKIAWGMIGFLILLVLSEIFIFRNMNFYVPEKKFIAQFAEIEHSFQSTNHEAINTAIFGDSQSIDGLRPEMLAKATGMNPEQLFNFSLSGGKAFEIYHTYLKYKDQMPNLKQAIVVVNEHQINNATPKIEQQPMFRYYAGLTDRFKVMNMDNYGDLLVGYALKSFDLRSSWTGILDKALESQKENTEGSTPKKKISFDVPFYPLGLAPKPDGGGDLSEKWAKDSVDRWMEFYDTNGILTDSLESLVRDLRSQGVKVTILQIPRTPQFEDYMRSKYAAQQQTFHEKVRAIANRNGAEFEIISAEGLDVKDNFRDVNHLNSRGAQWLSNLVAEHWLK
ncbi:hypothetical protein NV379_20575 [Paenibacillus sp. N1-5-1-14]|uniref:hypothetical protein n=1 Tax=Paenibacillus radicibacter TaxID=2972488 RepID=UPI002158B6D1|nr:hypothetical protein [Paenibacillus radicibacter]MCR8645054.1 hypothetical protein [Paenibacillus radicibacter]